MTQRLTDAQRQALAVLAQADREFRLVGVGTKTTEPGYRWPTVHWQTVRSLIDLGLATRRGACVVLTEQGDVVAGAPA